MDLQRSPTKKERLALIARRDRLATPAKAKSVRVATEALAKIAQDAGLASVRLRDEFVYSPVPAPGAPSDRKLPAREHRPPATRLLSATGIALKFLLTALFEAQTRHKVGQQHKNTRPILGKPNNFGWIDLIASGAESAGTGATYMTRSDKRTRQLRDTLTLLNEEGFLDLPNRTAKGNRSEGFLLTDEGGPTTADKTTTRRYTVPKANESTFSVPLTLFTRGWIHVLLDTEIAFLLMVARYQASAPDGQDVHITAYERIHHLGLGRDAYEAHKLFDDRAIVSVTPDPSQTADGKFTNYGSPTKPMPHGFRLLPEGLDLDGYESVISYLDARIAA